jgi:hypothetical protein
LTKELERNITRLENGVIRMAKNEKTSKRVAKKASWLLRKSHSRKVKSVSGSALTQVADKKRKHKR